MKSDQKTPHYGATHPISDTLNHIVAIFSGMGYSVATGPEMENEWNNFDALNVPQDHPARDMQDTFWIKNNPGTVLRTHTSPVQIRTMKQWVADSKEFPLAIIAPGKVFRNEATDATHESQFHQIEGLLLDTHITVAHLKGTLLEFFKQFIGPDAQIRLRPSFFPFVEPGFEVDVMVQGKWIEMLGAGMVHPNVLRNCGIDPDHYQGFAFGMGIDRLTILKKGISDIRLFYQGDLRINQD